jgi:type II secretory pathway predicted ATPase ExeA
MTMSKPKIGQALRALADSEERAFPSYPQVSRYFPCGSIEDARTKLGRTIERGDGPGLVIGGPGTGKSLLLQVLAAQFHEQFDIVLPACARLCTRRALLQSILFELGLPYRMRDEGDLRLSLLDHLLSKENCPSGLLLLIDEAQTLPVALLDELRVLTNLVRGALPRVRLVLAGSSSLEECFAAPELESFSQRLSARCYLGPFGREETMQFVRAQLAASHVNPDEIVAVDAWAAVFEATDGVPRLVNQLCDRALTQAVAAGKTQIDRGVIQAVWSDIQQLPTPWDTPETPAEAAPSQVVEFGSLSKVESNVPIISAFEADNEEGALVSAHVNEPDTELDIEVEQPVARTITTSRATTVQVAIADTLPADPFAERYDEEEVVIDNFAAWDEMFRRDTPRVANRRDPEFSIMVGAAIKATPANERRTGRQKPISKLEIELQNRIRSHVEIIATADPTMLDEGTTWPPLRIAEVSDAPMLPAQLITPPDEEPVLIIEEDNVVPPPKSPVRPGAYRNLFSRLRSG